MLPRLRAAGSASATFSVARQRPAGDNACATSRTLTGRRRAALEAAAGTAVSARRGGRNRRARHVPRAVPDARRPADVRAPDVLHQREGRAGARLSRTPVRGRPAGRDPLVSRRGVSAMSALVVASLGAIGWLYLLAGRGGFWRAAERDAAGSAGAGRRLAARHRRDSGPKRGRRHRGDPGVVAAGRIIRARSRVIVVDDHSSDDTAAIAHRVAGGDTPSRITVPRCQPVLAPGWSGKLWALHHGIGHEQTARRARPRICCLPMPISVMRRTRCGLLVSGAAAIGCC